MVRPVNSMRMGPVVHLFCYKVSSLLRSSAVCITTTMDQAFCKQRMTVLAEALHAGKANPYVEWPIPVRTKCCSYHDGSGTM